MKKFYLEEALKRLENDPNLPKNQIGPQCGGFITKKCLDCGGDVITTGRGYLREVCSKCQKPYIDIVYLW